MTTPQVQSPASGLRNAVGATATRLQHHYLDLGHTAQGSLARGQLAELRKFSSLRVEEHPLALETVLLMLQPSLDDRELGRGEAASASEQAAFNALTLFGVHMQSAAQPMHTPEASFAAACGALYRNSASNSIKPRFDAMQSARDEASRLTHLRSLVSLLRTQRLAFDYGRFAADLRTLSYPDKRNGVLLRWGRDFARGASRPFTTSN